ncbi:MULTISPECIES: prepilin-type N-terminal cleavage/methylation domain-containing protein [unclassified Lentimonas]|uniref:type IV pilus modification PilV family protein n=1 Tax=unclassified Lentimonas TaxID=2630993 RepID=UPI001321D5CF|nr:MULTISPECIES: prepilin-type N-terminal cleavage/methylation domain-containing protein [unclassified Lentimonas]CAA6677119.1 Unannotated [Lentimonas sp. CC4]CAA6686259.1 Unannotated [Lentimonas sp. CC6]CAA7074287.1 Unannotated [Lentimonas sp. CC4]CAA7171118.1 Unannotated [Lentimonas sp. CC21]CAA7180120.1 Unannotated [Lentimonas sp. CC8]
MKSLIEIEEGACHRAREFQVKVGQGLSGFTLVEVMFAVVVFSMMSLGLTAALIQSLKISDSVISKSTAHSIALGYAEQIMAYSYDTLNEALEDSDTFSLYSTSLGDSNVVTIEDSFAFGVENESLIVMDVDRDSLAATKTMPMRFTIDAESLNSGSNALRALEVTINYSYSPTAADHSSEAAWLSGQICIVKSLVNIY